MRRIHWLAVASTSIVTTLAMGACSNGVERTADSEADALALSSIHASPHKDVCSAPAPGQAHCHAKVRTDASGNAVTNATPQGHGPSDLQSAYALPANGGQGATVAIVDSYDDPTAESDLAQYRSTFGLPPCTTANGCFKKVNQSGQQGSYPSANTGWSQEISLDLDMVSATCPSCNIVLVEANSESLSDLGAGVNTAVALGAIAVSNSYGGGEFSSESSVASQYYNHPGVAITASSGDSGYGVEFPAAGAPVIAVGGTSLTKSSSSRGWAEAAWSGAGSGCSQVVTKPSWQTDPGCSKRSVVDVSAEADPSTGVAGYYNGHWYIFGGTSAAAPIVAGALAAAGKASSGASFLYAHASALNDVTTGSNGSCGSYLCNAQPGYDGPTGLGTINGAALMAVASGGASSSSRASGGSSSSTTGVASSSSRSSSTSSAAGSRAASGSSTGAASSSAGSRSAGSSSAVSSTADAGASASDAGATHDGASASSVVASVSILNTYSNGYCAGLTVTNEGAAAIASWTVQLETNDSLIEYGWNANFSSAGPNVTLTPLSNDAALATGASASVEFCAVATGSNWQPTVVAASGR